MLQIIFYVYVTHSRKRGHFQPTLDCKLDMSVDSTKSAVHAHEKHLTLALRIPKLQSFDFHTHSYLSMEISAFISVP